MVRLLQVLLRFYHHESCGQCTPCREGMGWMHRIIDRIVAGEGRPEDIDRLLRDLARQRRHDDLRHGRRRRLRDGRHPRTSSATSSSTSSSTSARAATASSRSAMPEIFINGQPIEADGRPDRACRRRCANGIFIPYFCWHPNAVGRRQLPHLRRPGRGRRAAAGSRSPATCRSPRGCASSPTPSWCARTARQTMQLITLNHPVDCGICDKAGECTLQDYHYEYNGAPSVSRDPKVHSTKFYPLSERIVLDNERCILCSRCVRFTREMSKSNALGHRRTAATTRWSAPVEDGSVRARPVLRQRHRHLPGRRAAVALVPLQGARLVPEADAVGLPGLRARLHRRHLAPQARVEAARARPRAEQRAIDRVTPRENPAVNGPWICNKGRDLAQIFERARADAGDAQGPPGRPAGGDRARAAR